VKGGVEKRVMEKKRGRKEKTEKRPVKE